MHEQPLIDFILLFVLFINFTCACMQRTLCITSHNLKRSSKATPRSCRWCSTAFVGTSLRLLASLTDLHAITCVHANDRHVIRSGVLHVSNVGYIYYHHGAACSPLPVFAVASYAYGGLDRSAAGHLERALHCQ